MEVMMKKAAIVCLLLTVPAMALAQRTCDACIDIDDAILPSPAEQVVSGSTAGEPNGEYTYLFCAVGGAEYTFTTCDGTTGGGADYDTALSVWDINGDLCGVNMGCNDDNCPDGSSGLLSTVSFTAPADGDYLIVVDGFSGNEGNYTLAYWGAPCTVATENTTWSSIKTNYR